MNDAVGRYVASYTHWMSPLDEKMARDGFERPLSRADKDKFAQARADFDALQATLGEEAYVDLLVALPPLLRVDLLANKYPELFRKWDNGEGIWWGPESGALIASRSAPGDLRLYPPEIEAKGGVDAFLKDLFATVQDRRDLELAYACYGRVGGERERDRFFAGMRKRLDEVPVKNPHADALPAPAGRGPQRR